jgi:hypothetical protein
MIATVSGGLNRFPARVAPKDMLEGVHMATLTARLDPDVFDEVREAQQLGCATFADAIDEAIRLCLPSAIVSVDAEATAVTIAVKDADLVRSLISLGIDEYNWQHGSSQESTAAVAPANEEVGGSLKELVGSMLAPLVSKPA